jgi:hypothetical protein
MKVFPALGLPSWSARANSFLPVPVSPVISTVTSALDTMLAARKVVCNSGELPISGVKLVWALSTGIKMAISG